MQRSNVFPVTCTLAVLLSSATAVHAQSTPANTPDYFELKVRPILANNCYSCHTETNLGNLRLDSRESLMKGGTRGPAVIAGDPEKSLLIQAVRHTDEKLKMPMGGKLQAADIEALVEWVKAGAIWPESKVPIAASPAAAPGAPYVISPERKKFWSL